LNKYHLGKEMKAFFTKYKKFEEASTIRSEETSDVLNHRDDVQIIQPQYRSWIDRRVDQLKSGRVIAPEAPRGFIQVYKTPFAAQTCSTNKLIAEVVIIGDVVPVADKIEKELTALYSTNAIQIIRIFDPTVKNDSWLGCYFYNIPGQKTHKLIRVGSKVIVPTCNILYNRTLSATLGRVFFPMERPGSLWTGQVGIYDIDGRVKNLKWYHNGRFVREKDIFETQKHQTVYDLEPSKHHRVRRRKRVRHSN